MNSKKPLQAANEGSKSKRARSSRPAPRSVSELASKVLQPVMARRAGMQLDLIAGWSGMVGEAHAAYTRPEKITWPRRANEDDPFSPGTLVVACDGARAVFFQHETGWIIERVNSYFGFPAISRIRILQKPFRNAAGPKPDLPQRKLTREETRRLDNTLARVDDDELKARLRKLGEGVMRRNAGKPRA